MSNLLQDLKATLRSFAKAPLFATVAVLTLALGIGPNAAIFSVVNSVLLSPLPYDDPDRLVTIWGELPKRDVLNFPHAPAAIERFRREATVIEDVAGAVTFNQALTTPGGATDQVSATAVTWNMPALLGLKPAVGRLFDEKDAAFTPDDVPEGAVFPQNVFNPPNTVLLEHGYWQRNFGGDPDVVGRIVRIAGNPATVVGVLEPGARLLLPPESTAEEKPQVWAAMRVDLENAPLTNVFLTAVGRLKPGVSLEQAQAEMEQISARLRAEDPIFETSNYRNRVERLHEDLTDDVRPSVLMLFGAVALVLLIACANMASLLLARAAGREREIAIRTAMGCSRSRLMMLLMVEAGVLCLAGGLLGLLLAHMGLKVLIALVPADLPRLADAAIDGLVLLFTLGVAVLATLLAGLYPAWQASRQNPADQLKERSGQRGGVKLAFRNGLVVAEFALSFVLLVGAGLMVRSFIELHRVDPGFQAEGVLTFNLNYPPDEFPLPESVFPFEDELRQKLAVLPGVESVGGAFPLPLTGVGLASRYAADEATFLSDTVRQADYRAVQPGYFKTLKTPLLRGRVFTQDDQENARPVAIVDEILAQQAWPGEDPVGKPLFVRLATPEPVEVEVVGVVAHQNQVSLDEDGREAVYLPSRFAVQIIGGGTFWTVRTAGNPTALVGPVRELVRDMNPGVGVTNVAPMSDLVDDAMAETQFALSLIGVFAVLAALLSAVGLYGVLAYLVRQRSPEFGIRMSLGADRTRIFGLVVRQGMLLALIGVVIGVVAALGLSRLMSALLVEVTPSDPATYLGITLLFAAVSLAACAVPALRATRVDPAVALRQE